MHTQSVYSVALPPSLHQKKSFDISYHKASDVIFDQLLYHFSILMIFTIHAHLVMIPQILSTPVILLIFPIPLIVPFFLSFNS